MRLPDWLYARLEHAYLTEKRIRARELRERVEAEDVALRAHWDRMREAHADGTCGGREQGCAYVPCIPAVSNGLP